MKPLHKMMITSFGIVVALALSIPVQLMAQDADTLAKDINSGLRAAQSTMFKGDYEQAMSQLDEIKVQLDQLKSIDPQNSKISSFEKKYEKYMGDISRRVGTKTESSSSSSAATESAKQSSDDKFPSGAKRCVKQIDTAIKNARRVIDSTGPSAADYRIKQANMEMQAADSAWEDLQKKYPEAVDHPEAVEAKKNIDAMYADIKAYESGAAEKQQASDQADAVRQTESNEWIEKINVYMESGSEKHFISGYTEQADDMNKRMKLFAELSELFNEYQAASFSEGKTDELTRLEKDVEYKLNIFKTELMSAAERYIEKSKEELDRGFEFLDRNEQREKDGEKPLPLTDMVLESITRSINWSGSLLPGDPRIAELEQRFEDLKKEQSKWREKMIESTVMLPDEFSGSEAKDLKSKADKIVSKKYPAAKILRTNVISSDWKEEEVLEFTDTTHSQVRYRITHSVSVQVAAKDKDTFLYTVYVAADRRSDGSWGELYGHIMFTDKMLEKNVNK